MNNIVENTAENATASNNKGSWIKFFAIKIFELILVGSIIGISFIFPTYEDASPWPYLARAISIGYFVIISVLLLNGFCKIRVHRRIHGLLNLIGCALFIMSGVRIIYYYKIQYDLTAELFTKTGTKLSFAFPAEILQSFKAFNNFTNDLTINPSVAAANQKLKKIFILGFLQGSMNIVEGLVLLIDSFLVFKKYFLLLITTLISIFVSTWKDSLTVAIPPDL